MNEAPRDGNGGFLMAALRTSISSGRVHNGPLARNASMSRIFRVSRFERKSRAFSRTDSSRYRGCQEAHVSIHRSAIRSIAAGQESRAFTPTKLTPDTFLRWHRQRIVRKWTTRPHSQDARRVAGASAPHLVADVSACALGRGRWGRFLTTKVWTWRGLVTVYTVFVIGVSRLWGFAHYIRRRRSTSHAETCCASAAPRTRSSRRRRCCPAPCSARPADTGTADASGRSDRSSPC